jgi:hypothetical protein
MLTNSLRAGAFCFVAWPPIAAMILCAVGELKLSA